VSRDELQNIATLGQQTNLLRASEGSNHWRDSGANLAQNL